jgi:uncharacterized protein (DUF488 family)
VNAPDQLPTVWTVGHSNRSLPDLLELLGVYGIELVADVRRYPGSRNHPQFQQTSLDLALHAAGIAYTWIPALGGRRRLMADVPESGWRHPAFRAYAAHSLGEEFAQGLVELLLPAQGLRTAMMCAEVLWWRCHRRIIADVVVSLGRSVVHILDSKTASPHKVTALIP